MGFLTQRDMKLRLVLNNNDESIVLKAFLFIGEELKDAFWVVWVSMEAQSTHYAEVNQSINQFESLRVQIETESKEVV